MTLYDDSASVTQYQDGRGRVLRKPYMVRLNEKEKARLRRLARRYRMSEAAVVRMLMLKADAER